ncbi:unnamed protein product [Onchocerca flexuosa]|uniref:Peptidase M12B domain-containing protein n=1 Tax=Onchocerca flexuosa TaxID=387005 RepID=A0A183HIY8_9BILA|nr:unnamed protein product [Onchocerca flexuosa]
MIIQNRDGLGIVYYNTALSSAKATHGGTVVSREADIVTAHELGHNWGATHDDLSQECSPPYSSGGSYIMNTFSVSGYDENNNRFSPCSRRLIGKVLSKKANICFEPEMSAFCGNGKVENDTNGFAEECDVGGLLSGTTDELRSGFIWFEDFGNIKWQMARTYSVASKMNLKHAVHQIVVSNRMQSVHQKTVHAVQVIVNFFHQLIFVFMKIDFNANFPLSAR